MTVEQPEDGSGYVLIRWEDTAGGGTKMTLRNRGQPTGFATVTTAVMMRAMRRANDADLRRLKALLER
jgi:hypothetical protein